MEWNHRKCEKDVLVKQQTLLSFLLYFLLLFLQASPVIISSHMTYKFIRIDETKLKLFDTAKTDTGVPEILRGHAQGGGSGLVGHGAD